MYNLAQELATFEKQEPLMLFLSLVSMVGGTIQFIEATRLTLRDKVMGFPFAYYCIVVVHDAGFALNYHYWHTLNFWYTSGILHGIIFFVIWEIGMILWFLPKAHKEYASDLPSWAFYAIYAVFQLLVIMAYHMFDLIDDPLDFVGLAPALSISVLFMIPFILRRRSTKGQSRLMAWAIFIPPATGMLMAAVVVPAIRTPFYYALVICVYLLGLSYVLLYEYYKRQENSSGRSVHLQSGGA